MLKNEIDAVRDRAADFNRVWASDYLEMARKTVVRRAAKFWPLRFESGAVRPFDEPERAVADEGNGPSATARSALTLFPRDVLSSR